jgi:hypothetical protein
MGLEIIVSSKGHSQLILESQSIKKVILISLQARQDDLF